MAITGSVPTMSPVSVAAREAAAQEPDVANEAVGWGQANWVAAPAAWHLRGLYGLVPVALLDCVVPVAGTSGFACAPAEECSRF